MTTYSIVLFISIVLIDSKHLGRIVHSILNSIQRVDFKAIVEKDSDVLETEKIVDVHFKDSLYVASNKLRRSYGLFRPKPAVRGVSFDVQSRQCFGLLGVNGAGKSTTFNMLTTQIARSQGDACIGKKFLSSWFLSEVSFFFNSK